MESCTMQIKLEPFFSRTPPLVKSKKLLGYVFQEPWRNEEAVTTLDTYLSQKQAEAKEAWEAASKRYQDKYISTQFRYDLTAQQKRVVETANRKRLNAVKRSKTVFERWCKINAHYETLKTKNHF